VDERRCIVRTTVLGEFFICGPDGLNQDLIDFGPSGRLPCVTAKGLTPVSIASLGALLGAGTHDEIDEQCGAEHYEAESGESGVWDVPGSVCQALLTRQNLEPIARQWVATDELQMDRWQPADGLSALTQLSELLRQQRGDQVLWYWWSL